MRHDAPLELFREKVRAEWIDYNGHMNVAYYVLAFDHATDAFLDYIGLDDSHRDENGGSTFAVESHVSYLREVRDGDPLRFTTQLLGYDAKRLHYFHRMYHADQGFLAATNELLSLYVDLKTRRVAAMPQAIQALLAKLMAAHAGLPRPPEAGHVIALPGAPAA
jgi:acyl-CoA thioester hydrolase